MILFIIISAFLFISVSGNMVDNGYCDASTKECENNGDFYDTKYLFYDINPPEGFNLRRDVYMRFAIMLSEAQKRGQRLYWNLVLPPWHNLYHWKIDDRKPIYWSRFFSISSLKKYATVVELHELFKNNTESLEIDILYVLQNYENPFENGDFIDKWEISKNDCNYNGKFWGFNNITAKEIVCVKFQGGASKLWEIVSLHPRASRIMFANGEIVLHDSYGTKAYWDCRKSMQFNDELKNTAEYFISNKLGCNKKKCENYISIHWRRQDFARYRINDVPSIKGTVNQVISTLNKLEPKIHKVFIATDATQSELIELQMQLNKNELFVFYYKPTPEEINQFKDGGVAIIDQIICSHAAYFIGTHESTFSFRIQEEREILGFDSKTTFNRLCPDKGKCEKASKWTIVN